MNILKVENLTKNFDLEGRKSINILKDISFSIKQGEFVAIVGSSGSGKSTLLSILAGLEKPSSGNVFLDLKNLSHISSNDLDSLRRTDVGFIFQSFYLIPALSALENVSFVLELNKINFSKASNLADSMIKKVGLSHRKHNFPNQLSGGEQQRVAIARAIIHKPKIIFADEPTGNLDSKNSKEIIDILLKLVSENKSTLVMVTHDENISKLADRVIRIVDGKVAD